MKKQIEAYSLNEFKSEIKNLLTTVKKMLKDRDVSRAEAEQIIQDLKIIVDYSKKMTLKIPR